MQEASPSEWF
jgi:hypothetical protein